MNGKEPAKSRRGPPASQPLPRGAEGRKSPSLGARLGSDLPLPVDGLSLSRRQVGKSRVCSYKSSLAVRWYSWQAASLPRAALFYHNINHGLRGPVTPLSLLHERSAGLKALRPPAHRLQCLPRAWRPQVLKTQSLREQMNEDKRSGSPVRGPSNPHSRAN